MNGCSSFGGPAAPSLECWVPQNVSEVDSPVTQALETVFQLQGAAVGRPPQEYPLPPETNAEQADPDWKWRQAEKIRAWRLKASLEPQLAAKGMQQAANGGQQAANGGQQAAKEVQQTAKEGQQAVKEAPSRRQARRARARRRAQAYWALKSEQLTSTHDDDLDSTPQIPGAAGQQITGQADVSARGQGQARPGDAGGLTVKANHVQGSAGEEPALQGIPEDTGPASASELGERMDRRNAETADESEDDEEACMAPCSDDENENLKPMVGQHQDEPGKSFIEKKKSWANDPAPVQSSEQAKKLSENQSISIITWTHDPVQSSEQEKKLSESQLLGVNRTTPKPKAGLSCSASVQPTLVQTDKLPISIVEDSTSGMTKGEQPGGSPSCRKEEAKALKSTRDDQPETVAAQNDKPAADKSWVLCQAARIKAWREAQEKGLHPAPSGVNVESNPVDAATGLGAWSQVTRKRVHASVEVGDEQLALSQGRDQAKHVALEPDSDVASSSGHQAGEVSLTPVSEAGSKPIDKSWALCQAAKIKAWCEANRKGANVLPSSQNVETPINPKHRVVETIPVHHTERLSKQSGEQTIKPSAPNVEAVQTSNRWVAESTPVQQVYNIKSLTDARRGEELTDIPSNLINVQGVHNSKQWTVDSMRVRQGPERGELAVAPSGSNIKLTYGDKWWAVENHSSYQPGETGAERETSSSGKSSFIARDHNVKAGQLVVGSTSVHQNPSFQPWWKEAKGEPIPLQNHVNVESRYNPKLGVIESMPLCQTSGIESWSEGTGRRNPGLLNIETAHSSMRGAGESGPVHYTAGLTPCKDASILESGFTWEQGMTRSSQHVVDDAAQSLPNDYSAWWRRVGDKSSRQPNWLLSGRRVSKTDSNLSFVAAEKKRMQEWAQALWNQAASK